MTHDRRLGKLATTIAAAVFGIGFLTAAVAVAADPGATCAIAKQKAAAKKLNDKVKCHGKALKKGSPVDPVCLTKAEEKFNASFTKAEDKGGCLTTSDAAAIETIIDNTLAALLAALPAM